MGFWLPEQIFPDVNLLSGFCWTGTGVWRVKYKAAGKFKLILIFGILSLSIIILIIISNVALHNKIAFTV